MSNIIRAGRNEFPTPYLLKEYAFAFENSNESHFDWMRDKSVTNETLYRGPAVFGVERIITDGAYYQPHEESDPAIINPIGRLSNFEVQLIDLCAWRADAPDNWWLRIGSGNILGVDAVERANHFKKPLIVHANPLAWLQHDCQGCVVLAWGSGLRLALGGIQQFGCTDENTCRCLDELLRSNRSSSYEIRIVEIGYPIRSRGA